MLLALSIVTLAFVRIFLGTDGNRRKRGRSVAPCHGDSAARLRRDAAIPQSAAVRRDASSRSSTSSGSDHFWSASSQPQPQPSTSQRTTTSYVPFYGYPSPGSTTPATAPPPSRGWTVPDSPCASAASTVAPSACILIAVREHCGSRRWQYAPGFTTLTCYFLCEFCLVLGVLICSGLLYKFIRILLILIFYISSFSFRFFSTCSKCVYLHSFILIFSSMKRVITVCSVLYSSLIAT